MCGGFKAIYPDRADQLSRSTQEQIVGHNEHGEKLGCEGFTPVGAKAGGLGSLFGR